MISDVRGLVLTGGRSERMGTDKAEICYHDLPQWRHLGDLLEDCCAEVYWSCSAEQRDAWYLDDSALVDTLAGIGPAGGLLTAFSLLPETAWLVVACDFPYIQAADLRLLLSMRDLSCDATAYCNPEDGLPEPFFAIWEPAAQRRLTAAVRRGETSPRRVLLSGAVALAEATDPHVLMNVNTPDEMARL